MKMKELLNLKQMKGAVTNATKEELEALRPIVLLTEKVIEGLGEINRQAKQPIPVFNFRNNRMFSPHMKRILLDVGCLTLYINDKSQDWVISAAEALSPLLPRLEAWSMYSRHMRQHPSLARRRSWQQYINMCDADTLESLRVHHHLFFQQHPEWKDVLIPGERSWLHRSC
jgi:hypothetical protein